MRLASNASIAERGRTVNQTRSGRNHVAAGAASRQLKLRLRLRNRPSSVEFQSAQADLALVAATSVARCGRGSHNEIALKQDGVMEHGKNGIKSFAPGPCYNDRLYGRVNGIAAGVRVFAEVES
jgi:hypothetical protein